MKRNSYNTEPKRLILSFLSQNADKYVSAEDILEYLNNSNQKVGLTTIYRFLNLLEKEGKLRIEVIKNTKFYQYILDSCENHYHLKCEKCGKTEHFECDEIIEFNKHIEKEHKFKISSKNVIYGLCTECSERMEEAK